MSFGATATVSGNNVSGYDYTPPGTEATGILLYQANASIISGNNVHDNEDGIYLYNSNGASVTGNSLPNIRGIAVVVDLSNNGTYSGNTVMGQPASTGMYVYDSSSNNSVTGNAFRNGDFGVIVDFTGAGTPALNQFNGNCLAGNIGAGVSTTGTLVGPKVDAKANWWGAVNGATPPGSGDSIIPGDGSTIDASAFLVAPVVGCPTPTTDSDSDGLTDVSEVNFYLTDWQNPDTDADGCADGEEVAADHNMGGQRNPLYHFDFYDVTGDKSVDLSDTLLILAHFGHGPSDDALDNELDRAIGGPGFWNTIASDTGIDLTDALANLRSFGDDCSGPP